MSLLRTIKATVIGIHADYHTGFERLRTKYELEYIPVEPSARPEFFDKKRDEWNVADGESYTDYQTKLNRSRRIGDLFTRLEKQGWTDLVALGYGESDNQIGLIFEGTLKKRHRINEVIAPKTDLRRYKVKRYDLRKLRARI